ncbi:TPA: hypothetical protein ACH3X3_012762 [Trebouxia sp. C0006]
MTRPRAHVSHRKSKSKYAPDAFKAHLRSVALGRTKAHKRGGGSKKSHKKHVRHHRHRAGTEKRKGAAYCTRPYHKWYKAVIYLNGAKVQEIFDFSQTLQELKERLRLRIKQLDASSSTPLTQAVLWTSEPSVCDSEAEAIEIQAT